MEQSGYHTLRQEILEQPALFKRLLALPATQWTQLPAPDRNRHRRVIALGEGSSYQVLQIVAPWLSALLGMDVQVMLPADYETRRAVAAFTGADERSDDVFWILVSQSGKTASILEAIREQPFDPDSVLVVTNTPDSPMTHLSAQALLARAGTEQSIAATKTVGTACLCLLQWALSVSTVVGAADKADLEASLNQLPDSLSRLENESVQAAMRRFAAYLVEASDRQLYFALMSTAYLSGLMPEIALKWTETALAYVSYSGNSETFRHGPKAVMQRPIVPVYWALPDDEAIALLEKHAQDHGVVYMSEGKHTISHPFAVVQWANEPMYKELSESHPGWLTLPEATHPFEVMFSALMTGQLLSAELANALGINPNSPRLTKTIAQ